MAANFSPNAGELALVNQIFAVSDPQKLGVLTGEVAVRVFGGAHLQPSILGQIWGIADDQNQGWLSKKGVAVAVRLIGWAQKGEPITEELISKPGPLPTIDGVTVVAKHNTGPALSLSKSPPPGLPPFTPQDKAKFQKLFQSCGPVNGLLSADVARDVFVKSKLSVDKLSQIWNLADSQDRGALDATDFAIGMYLIQATMSGQLSFIPTSLPPGLYEQAGGVNPHSSINVHHTGTSGSFSPTTSSALSQQQGRSRPLQPQYTGQSLLQPQTTGYRQQQQVQQPNNTRTPPPVAPRLPSRPAPASSFGASAFGSPRPANNQPWDVTPAEKASSDQFFDGLDDQKRGYIEGDVAVPFMLESKLSENDLALVWDLSDIQGNGRLTRDGFAVAMHLIQGKLAGKPIPSSLPASLIPPSMRSSQPQPQPEPVVDLLWGDDTPPSSATLPRQQTGGAFTQQPQQAQHTGGGINAVASHSTGPQLSIFAPPANAVRSDPFASSASAHFPNQQVAPQDQDLLGDDADVVETTSALLQTQAAEVGNVQNHLTSTHKSLENTKAERAALEQALANQAGQLSALQTQLETAKAAYETEVGLAATLKERLAAQTSDINKTRTELISAESDLSAIRLERSEIEGSFLRDKEEARDLHRKMVEIGQQVEAEKVEVEKVKKDAKQQKGLLAIARKQLSTKEAERARVRKELEEANVDRDATLKEKDEVEAVLTPENESADVPTLPTAPERALSSDSLAFAASHALPGTPGTSSPAASILSTGTAKSNNPFDRLALGSGTSTPRSQSPYQSLNAHIVSSPVADADPFGFSTHSNEQAKEESNLGAGLGTPKQAPADIFVPANGTHIDDGAKTGTESDHDYTTPPSTARRDSLITPTADVLTTLKSTEPNAAETSPESAKNKAAEKTFPDLDLESDQISPFPALATIPGHFPLSADAEESNETSGWGAMLASARPEQDNSDITQGPHTLDVVGSESDSDSDSEDEVPLSELKGKGKEKDHALTENANVASSPTGAAFDDVFGSDEASAAAPLNLFDSKTVPAVAGVNAFDEAMGTIPGSTAAQPAAATADTPFSFDSFDDNFDFASASATAETVNPASTSAFPAVSSPFPPPPNAVNGNGHAKNTDDGFDGIFAVSGNGAATTNTSSGQPTTASFDDVFTTAAPAAAAPTNPVAADKPELSFDEAFSGMEPSQALKLDSSFESPASKSNISQSNASTFSHPSSPHASISVSTRASSPPLHQRSPPPRTLSPKPRPSSSSHKDTHHDKDKPVKEPTKSKLSIRLPFGRKKKTPAPEPMPSIPAASSSTHLSAPVGENGAERANTPALSDDVDAVKQLCSMGFSRTKAVQALEASGYDVQKALNSLI